MRNFNYITVGDILSSLKDDGVTVSRPNFYRLEKKLHFPYQERSTSRWRVYTAEEAIEIKDLIKSNYRITNNRSIGRLNYLEEEIEKIKKILINHGMFL